MYEIHLPLHAFLSNTFISNASLKLTKDQANAKEHPIWKLFTFFLQKSKWVSIYKIIRLIKMKMKIKMKNTSHRYDINRPTSRNGHEYCKYKNCFTMMFQATPKQYLNLSSWKSYATLRLSWKKGLLIKDRVFNRDVNCYWLKRSCFQSWIQSSSYLFPLLLQKWGGHVLNCSFVKVFFMILNFLTLTKLSGKNCVFLNSVHEWLVGCFWPF